MQKRNRECLGGSCRTGLGLNQCSNNWSKPPPLIPDRLSNVFLGWVWGFFIYLFSNLFAAWLSQIGCNQLRSILWDCGGSKWRIWRGEKAAIKFLPQEFSRWHLWESLRENSSSSTGHWLLVGMFLGLPARPFGPRPKLLGGGGFSPHNLSTLLLSAPKQWKRLGTKSFGFVAIQTSIEM